MKLQLKTSVEILRPERTLVIPLLALRMELVGFILIAEIIKDF